MSPFIFLIMSQKVISYQIENNDFNNLWRVEEISQYKLQGWTVSNQIITFSPDYCNVMLTLEKKTDR